MVRLTLALDTQIIYQKLCEILYAGCCAYVGKHVYWRHWRAGLAANEQRHITVKATMKHQDQFLIYYYTIKHGCWKFAAKMLRF